ncbi:MAG: 30S ribosomal protein S6 [Microgenomates group bacterium]
MRAYELTLVVDPDLTSEKQKKQIEKIKKIIADLKGEVKKITEWGKRELAYPIKKKNMGCYFLWEIEMPQESASELNSKLKIEEGLLRYLIVKREKPHFVKTTRGKEVNKDGAKIA